MPNRSPVSQRLRIALVGCGQIADAHLQEIRKIGAVDLVAVCDGHRDLAQRAADFFEVPSVYDRLDAMLREARPDVVHVATPAGTHRDLAIECLAAGAHVYVEKPFTLDAPTCHEVLEAARRAGRLVCVGHNELFDPIWLEARAIVDSGRLGRVVHVDSVQGYDLSGPFGSLLAAEPQHWVRRLPGGLFHNTISHPVYKITEFLRDEQPDLLARWFAPHPQGGFPTELRVTLMGAQTSATLLVSSAARPVQRIVRIYGTEQSLEIEVEGRMIRPLRGMTVRGPFVAMQVPLREMLGGAKTLLRNVGRFLKRDIHYFAGMKTLFERFYAAARGEGPLPIAPEEIARVTAIMDGIFATCRAGELMDAPSPVSRETEAKLNV